MADALVGLRVTTRYDNTFIIRVLRQWNKHRLAR